jgi:ankyrin repeat protein
MEVVKANVLALIVRSCVTSKVCPKKILFKSYPMSHMPVLGFCRGSNPAATDSLGKTPLESAMEQGAITDDELFVMLSEPSR